MQQLTPSFLVRREAGFRAWAEALAVLCRPMPATHPRPRWRTRFARRVLLRSVGAPVRALTSSMLLHFSVLLFVLHVQVQDLFRSSFSSEPPVEVVYDLRTTELSPYLPAIRSAGTGGAPGQGTRPKKAPARGSTTRHPRLSLTSTPVRFDNTRQTIVQPVAPPDVEIRLETPLPLVVVQSAAPKPRLPSEITLNLPVRVSEPPRPQTDPALPSIPITNPKPSLSPPSLIANSLPLPAPPLQPAPPPQSSDGISLSQLGSRTWGAEGAGELLLLSASFAPAQDTVSVPPGNRYGSFTVSPQGGQPGSPGGVPGGDPRGGAEGGPGAGDGSSGVGPGKDGGGGTAPSPSNLSVSTPEEGSAGATRLSPSVAANLVYPVPAPPPRLRRPGFIFTAGPTGGGGLGVYGVLRGGRIYTVYLTMPGKKWILQYCRNGDPSGKGSSATRNVTVRLDQGLVPPFAEEMFDFRRPSLPGDKVNEMIVLGGVIQPDGSVDGLKIVKGVQANADEAALAAFGRWKFKPALEAGEPVAVQILVGIPAWVPGQGSPSPPASNDP